MYRAPLVYGTSGSVSPSPVLEAPQGCSTVVVFCNKKRLSSCAACTLGRCAMLNTKQASTPLPARSPLIRTLYALHAEVLLGHLIAYLRRHFRQKLEVLRSPELSACC